MKFILAAVAKVNRASRGIAIKLEDRFLFVARTVCTKHVLRLAALHAWLRRKSINAFSDFGKLVAIGLTFPAFQVSNFPFKLGYPMGKSRLLLLGQQPGGLGLHKLGVHLGDRGDELIVILKRQSSTVN